MSPASKPMKAARPKAKAAAGKSSSKLKPPSKAKVAKVAKANKVKHAEAAETDSDSMPLVPKSKSKSKSKVKARRATGSRKRKAMACHVQDYPSEDAADEAPPAAPEAPRVLAPRVRDRDPPILVDLPVAEIPVRAGGMASQPVAHESLWDPATYLDNLAVALVGRLNIDARAALITYMSGNTWSFASFCAGTDCPRQALEVSSDATPTIL
jgi:hypothetical protein